MNELREVLCESIEKKDFGMIWEVFQHVRKHFCSDVSTCLDFKVWEKKFFDYIIEEENKDILQSYWRYLGDCKISESGDTIKSLIKQKNKEILA